MIVERETVYAWCWLVFLGPFVVAACWPAPTLPPGATPCSGPNDCNYPLQTCGFAGVNQVATCVPNDYATKHRSTDAGQ